MQCNQGNPHKNQGKKEQIPYISSKEYNVIQLVKQDYDYFFVTYLWIYKRKKSKNTPSLGKVPITEKSRIFWIIHSGIFLRN